MQHVAVAWQKWFAEMWKSSKLMTVPTTFSRPLSLRRLRVETRLNAGARDNEVDSESDG